MSITCLQPTPKGGAAEAERLAGRRVCFFPSWVKLTATSRTQS